jgi:hypothetical protein
MIHICIFSGHEGQLRPDKKFYFTLFGGFTLTRPTLARQILGHRRAKADGRSERTRPFFLTIFGGGSIEAPTLAEEFIDLRELLNSKTLYMEDWERTVAELDQAEASISSLTLFGGFSECELPSENAEIEGIARHRHLGSISENAGRVLQFGIGQRDADRRATIRRALLEPA